ncbi:MAG TPA: bifunctional glutamate N-acetyltransferase/amino-acid acetyltransferase ArgJ [Nitrospiria bacterium]|nr:bifunctional glutamate N-acetyltransferase/amino-acid acetyltransferase ArgJ [Nitrospiria bacterium]
MRIRTIRGGLTAVDGIRAAGVWAGIKPVTIPDLALIVSDRPAVAAGLFTRNRFQAPPLRLTRRHLRDGRLQAIIVNSGNANACTGAQGLRDAGTMARDTARLLGLPLSSVAVASTGVIGVALPIGRIRRALPRLAAALSPTGGSRAARAIMTTDTRPKEVSLEARIGGRMIRVGGIAKGGGMVHPQMATMLAFLATDAPIAAPLLRRALREAADGSFHAITIDDMSTNDLVLCLATGGSGGPSLAGRGPAYRQFCVLLTEACQRLALQMIADAEGGTKIVRITVRGAATPAQARAIAMAVARSPLVKTAFYGEDPNWGRIMAAIGASGAAVRERDVSIAFGPVTMVRGGRSAGAVAERRAARVLHAREIPVRIAVGRGRGAATIWTSDLTDGYVRINAHYRT